MTYTWTKYLVLSSNVLDVDHIDTCSALLTFREAGSDNVVSVIVTNTDLRKLDRNNMRVIEKLVAFPDNYLTPSARDIKHGRFVSLDAYSVDDTVFKCGTSKINTDLKDAMAYTAGLAMRHHITARV